MQGVSYPHLNLQSLKVLNQQQPHFRHPTQQGEFAAFCNELCSIDNASLQKHEIGQFSIINYGYGMSIYQVSLDNNTASKGLEISQDFSDLKKNLQTFSQTEEKFQTLEVKVNSSEDYQAVIKNSFEQNIPLTAPFIVDRGWYMAEEPYQLCKSEWAKGRPIAKEETASKMVASIKRLIDASISFVDFGQSVADLLASAEKNTVPESMVGKNPFIDRSKEEKAIIETQMAILQMGSSVTQMPQATFEAIKNGSLNPRELFTQADHNHSGVITEFDPRYKTVTIVHSGEIYKNIPVDNLYASSQLLPDELKGVLYTFHDSEKALG